MRAFAVAAPLALLLGGVSEANADDREKLNGSWTQPAPPENSPASAWTFRIDGNTIHVTQMDGANKIADFECGTQGASCEVKSAGKKASVSLWYNGAKLMQMETKGSDVVERSFAISMGDTLEIEIIPIVPSGKKETFQYQRVQLSAKEK